MEDCKNNGGGKGHFPVLPTAKDRWKLLRQAILGSNENDGGSSKATSLHSFAGYQLVRPLDDDDDEKNKDEKGLWFLESRHKELTQFLCQVEWNPEWMKKANKRTAEQRQDQGLDSLIEYLHDTILAVEALQSVGCELYNQAINVEFCLDQQSAPSSRTPQQTCLQFLNDHLDEIQNKLIDFLRGRKVSCRALSSSLLLCVVLELVFENDCRQQSGDLYQVRCYQCPQAQNYEKQFHEQEVLPLLVRERMSRLHFSLAELTSHNNHEQKVDNTGNVFIWDAEKTLTWALAQTEPKSDYGTVLELGIGMAGLAGLSLSQRCQRLILTDGHEQCVQNNRINVRLLQAYRLLLQKSSCRNNDQPDQSKIARMECRVLRWTLPENDVDIDLQDCADLVLVSDCTHFEHYHGHLLWTLLQCTKPRSGTIWMCQPERGKSLQRFLHLIHDVNRGGGNNNQSEGGDETTTATPLQSPLLAISEPSFPHLKELHERFLSGQRQGKEAGAATAPAADPNYYYRPNVHQPRIIVLTKLRPTQEQDRTNILNYVARRNKTQ